MGDGQDKSTKYFLMTIGIIAIAGLSYFAGTLHTNLLGGVKSIFGEDTVLDTSSLQETYQQISEHFDGDIDTQALIDGANRGMVDALGDDYTVFMNQKETEEFNRSLSGDIGGGIGVEVGVRYDRPTVLRVLRDNPAEKAGVQVGDVIIAVNDESTADASVSDVVQKIRGDPGTTVRLTFLRDNEEVVISVTRAQVTNPSVYSSLDRGIGIITITRFDSDTGSLARDAARELVSGGAKGVILDLRGNGGGYVDAAEDVAGIWLNNKLIVTEKTGGRVVEEITSGTNPILESMPTVVLIDESSASASEIVAGALRDHKKATIVGQTSFGKGSVQRLLNLSDGATLKVTIARWYTPSGLNISEKGIEPDKKIENTPDDRNNGRDPQLDTAKKTLE